MVCGSIVAGGVYRDATGKPFAGVGSGVYICQSCCGVLVSRLDLGRKEQKMKNEVTIKDAKLIPPTATFDSFADVKLTRAQLEAALKEINEPLKPRFEPGDVVTNKVQHNSSRPVIEFVVLSTGISRAVQKGYKHLKNLTDPITLMSIPDGGSNTFERSEVEKDFVLVRKGGSLNQ